MVLGTSRSILLMQNQLIFRRGVKDMLKNKIQEECLRTYLFTYSNVYDSISLPRLAEMYSMNLKRVHSIVAKMIINQELMVSSFFAVSQLSGVLESSVDFGGDCQLDRCHAK